MICLPHIGRKSSAVLAEHKATNIHDFLMKPNAQQLENIFTELVSVYENLKAEVLIAEIQEKSEFSSEDFVIANKSTFSRPYRRDIISVDNLLNDNKITFNLSRNGIYDTLPEGVFHVPKGAQDSSLYLAEKKIAKEEEDAARSFFSPIENEFFHQRLRIERSERELLDDFYNLNDDFLIDFWNIDKQVPKGYLLKLIKLLPHSHKISGDFELTRLCLEKILGEKVVFERKFENNLSTENSDVQDLREIGLQLGVNSVLSGNDNIILSPVLKVTIGPISEKNINNYLKKDGVLKFINTFYDYFVPMEIEVSTKFEVNSELGFVLDDTNEVIMGISTKI
jgi:hypothetical protein